MWSKRRRARRSPTASRSGGAGEIVAAIRELVDDVVAVGERQMLDAIALLHAREQVIAEPTGAATAAALMARPWTTGTTVALVTGCNIAPGLMPAPAKR
jgi:threonine dehydratase